MSPFSLLFSDDSQIITLQMIRIIGKSDADLTDSIQQRIAGQRLPEIHIRQSTPEAPASGRHDSPGEAKGGIRVSVGAFACTATAAAPIGNEYYLDRPPGIAGWSETP